jgi:hypothetical protein
MAAMGSSSPIDPNWYLNSGVTNHITGELEALTMHEKYSGNDQIQAVTCVGMYIIHVGNTVLPSISHPLHINIVLHVPHAHKHPVSMYRFNIDNNTFIKLHPYFFLIKDRVMRKVLLRGHVEEVFTLCNNFHPPPARYFFQQ